MFSSGFMESLELEKKINEDNFSINCVIVLIFVPDKVVDSYINVISPYYFSV